MPTKVTLDTRAAANPPRRGPGWVVPAIVGGAAVVGLVAGLLLTAGSADTPTAARTTAPATAAPSGEDQQDLDADGEDGQVSDLPRGPVTAGGGGTRRGPDGVPVGFAHTQDGAVCAATVYLQVLRSSGALQPAVRQDVLKGVATPAARGAVDTQVAGEARALGLNSAGQPSADRVVLATVRPEWGAYRVAGYDARSSEVVVWHYEERGVAAAGGDRPAGTWSTSTIRLQWTAGDWKLAGPISASPGPTPDVAPRAAPPIAERARLLGSAWQLYANTES